MVFKEFLEQVVDTERVNVDFSNDDLPSLTSCALVIEFFRCHSIITGPAYEEL